MKTADTMKNFLKDQTGATAIEYALIASAMGLALFPAVNSLTGGVSVLYGQIADLFVPVS